MKVYVVATSLGEYQDALRALGLHDRAAVHVTPERLAAGLDPNGPVLVVRDGRIEKLDDEPRRAA